MEGPPLPMAALSLHAFAVPGGVGAASRPAARPVKTAPPAIGIRDGPRSHPIEASAFASSAVADRAPVQRSQPHPLQRLVAAVPAALSRLLSTPVNQAPFTGPAWLSDMRVFSATAPRRGARGGSTRPAGGGGRKAAIVWFRNDLRLHDNPALEQACRAGTSVLPVYVFDPRDYGKTPGGFDRTGPGRARFVLDAVSDLRQRLRAAGSDLVVRVGRAEAALAELAQAVGAGAVYCQSEVTAEEAQAEGRVRASLDREGCELRPLWGGTLFHLEDLPFRLDAMPTSYADFRSRVASLRVRPLAESDSGIKGLPAGTSIEPGDLPSLQQLGLSPSAQAQAQQPLKAAGGGGAGMGSALSLPSGGVALRGGESEALRHLQAFMDELKQSLSAAASKGASSPASPAPAPSATFSCRISPWLALGCLSPRRMYHEMQRQLGPGAQVIRAPAAAAVAAPVTAAPAAPAVAAAVGPANWLVFELLWRDFFRFVTQKYASGTRLAAAKGARAGAGAAAAAPAQVLVAA